MSCANTEVPLSVKSLAANFGWSLEDALSRMGDKPHVLRNSLREFLPAADNLADCAIAALMGGRPEEAACHLHGLKGLAKTLGILGVALAAEICELRVMGLLKRSRSAKVDIDASAIMREVTECLNSFRVEVLEILQEWEDQARAVSLMDAPPVSHDSLRAELKNIASLLACSDMHALECLQSLIERNPGLDGSRLRALEVSAHALRFGAAITIIEDWIGELEK